MRKGQKIVIVKTKGKYSWDKNDSTDRVLAANFKHDIFERGLKVDSICVLNEDQVLVSCSENKKPFNIFGFISKIRMRIIEARVWRKFNRLRNNNAQSWGTKAV